MSKRRTRYINQMCEPCTSLCKINNRCHPYFNFNFILHVENFIETSKLLICFLLAKDPEHHFQKFILSV